MTETGQIHSNDDLAGRVGRVETALRNGDFASAERQAKELTHSNPTHKGALYCLAVAQRYQGRPSDALATLERLTSSHPDYGRAYQETGHNHHRLGRQDQAITAYLAAVRENPALIASWKKITQLAEATGKAQLAGRATERLSKLSLLPKELLSVMSFTYEGKLLKAEKLCRHFLTKSPHHIEAMRLLAEIGSRTQVLDDAEFLLESCVTLQPDHLEARFDYVRILNKRQKYSEAYAQAGALRKLSPNEVSVEALYAQQCSAIGKYEDAMAIYSSLIERVEDPGSIHLAIGHIQKTIGDQNGAVSSYQRALNSPYSCGDAFWSLANMKTYEFSGDELALMQEKAVSDRIDHSSIHFLHFALGKSYEQRGHYSKAFTHYQKGNALKLQGLRYDPAAMSRNLAAQTKHCTQELFDKFQGSGFNDNAPIFIVGMPRAGSTLIEQILASHSRVEGTHELGNIPALAHQLGGRQQINDTPKYPACLADLEPEQLHQLGEKYIQDTMIHRSGAPHFIDKMPNNFRHIGLISLILPDAKIIDIRRNPMDCCLSNYKQLFAEGQEFSYALDSLGKYYSDYISLMDHWDRVLPGKILRIQYEDLVQNFDTELERIFAYCELPFEESCKQFHQTQRNVRTASSEQVRQPLYVGAIDYWRHFEAELEPLKDTLKMAVRESNPLGPTN